MSARRFESELFFSLASQSWHIRACSTFLIDRHWSYNFIDGIFQVWNFICVNSVPGPGGFDDFDLHIQLVIQEARFLSCSGSRDKYLLVFLSLHKPWRVLKKKLSNSWPYLMTMRNVIDICIYIQRRKIWKLIKNKK